MRGLGGDFHPAGSPEEPLNPPCPGSAGQDGAAPKDPPICLFYLRKNTEGDLSQRVKCRKIRKSRGDTSEKNILKNVSSPPSPLYKLRL